ncbi:MAG: hypothetical protein M3Y78_03225 [Pseudomonadota bacterium]|nr:hypothetical protein [Pseudomonadota bacterium]
MAAAPVPRKVAPGIEGRYAAGAVALTSRRFFLSGASHIGDLLEMDIKELLAG